MEPNELIVCRDASLGYEGQSVLAHLDLTIRAGDYLCIVGDNGSGKSTLLRGLLGLLSPQSGEILRAPELRQGAVGYLPQQTRAQRDFPATVYEVVLSGCLNQKGLRFFYTAAQKSAALMNMGKLGILELKDQSYRDLSGGQQQRVLLARALCAARSLLILDEPITGLDPAAAQDLYKTLSYLNRKEGMAVVMVTHDLRAALRSARTVLHIGRSSYFLGTVKDYLASPPGAAVSGGGGMSLTLMLTYPFMQRALIAGTLVSLCAALLGVPLVLKRYSMIGDGLSHVSFGALAIAVALGFTPLYFSIPVVILAAFFLLRLATNPRWNSDAAIAVMSASALAVGIIVISRTSGMTTDVDNYMFGSVLAMTWADVALSAVLSLAVLALFVLFYHKLFAVTFDESFSRATGLRVDWYNTLLAILTALTIVLGMRMMGAMLISSLVIFPALTAMRLFKSFRGVVVCAAVTSVCCFCAGLMASWTLSTPVGASVVAANLALFLLSCAAGWLRRR